MTGGNGPSFSGISTKCSFTAMSSLPGAAHALLRLICTLLRTPADGPGCRTRAERRCADCRTPRPTTMRRGAAGFCPRIRWATACRVLTGRAGPDWRGRALDELLEAVVADVPFHDQLGGTCEPELAVQLPI